MRHVLIGGDGFVGRHLTRALVAEGESVLVADLQQTAPDIPAGVAFVRADVTDPASLDSVPVGPDDVVYNLAARLLVPILPRGQRQDYFWSVNHDGHRNVIERMERAGAGKLVYFTTDMVYGHTRTTPKTEDHPVTPLGPYGAAKAASEALCREARSRGMSVSIFRPRLIIGPGRLGILSKLFRLIDLNLPVPVIGNGRNPYQFISVYDCVTAAKAAAGHGCPNGEWNLGSLEPPPVERLLGDLIKRAESRSILLRTPAGAVKATLGALDRLGMPLMDPEQYLIADETCILDVSKAERELGWRPQYRDSDMLIAAFEEYRRGRTAGARVPAREAAR
ncbi:MAG: NAD(P)-dependent oxidoreductase [Azospirillaceae bacterium]